MQLFSHIIGSGQPLLILHGLFGMSDNWISIARRLTQFGIVAHLPDLRNHGRSPHRETHTYKDMCDDILSYLDQEKIEKVSLVGHSMGGKVAMYFGLLHPERVTDMVVVDIAPASYCCHEGSLHAIIMDHLMAMDLSAYKTQSAIMAEIERRLKDRTLMMFLGKNIRREAENHYAWKLNLPVLKKYLPSLYAGLEALDDFAPSSVRTLFIKGNNSNYIMSQHEPDMQRYFPNYRIAGVDNAGHWLHAEQPDKVVEMIAAFFAH